MNLSLIDKFVTIFKYIFSSYLSIEMLIISLLLFFILVYNIKNDNHYIQMLAIAIYIGFIIGIVICYSSYVQTSFNSFVKWILNYIYFPSTVVYLFMIIFITVMIIYTLFTKKISNFKKIFNYSFFSIIYFLFMSFMVLATYDGVDLLDKSNLYKNNIILSLIQISNLLLVIWLIFTGFYYLYMYFKKRFD